MLGRLSDNAHPRVTICFDPDVLRLLVSALERLRGNDHDHLMTPAWSGTDLDERPLGEGTKLIHHLRLVRRETRW